MIITLGIDIGSCFSKGILLESGKPLASFQCLSAGDYQASAEKIRKQLLTETGINQDDIHLTVATGYGAKQVAFASQTRSDISCHTKGVWSLMPSARTIIDVGDFHTKVIRVMDNGSVHNFLLSGNCAGGSSRIMQVIAKVLQISMEDMGDLSLGSKNRIDFNTGCAVFAESEAISRVAEGVAAEDLLAGLNRALAAQIVSLAERIGVEPELVLSGGGARNTGLVKTIQELRGHPVLVLPEPHMSAALGAALIAMERVQTPGNQHFYPKI